MSEQLCQSCGSVLIPCAGGIWGDRPGHYRCETPRHSCRSGRRIVHPGLPCTFALHKDGANMPVFGRCPCGMHQSVEELIAAIEAERDRLRAKVFEWEAWADSVAHDERVEGWVHQESYSLYCLLADPEIELEPTP